MNISDAILKTVSILILALSTQLARADLGASIPGNGNAFDTAVSDDLLSGQRGKALIPTNTNDLDGIVSGNTANDLLTGQNLISDGSLINNSGMNTVIQNTGNNVLIQNAVILNIQLQ